MDLAHILPDPWPMRLAKAAAEQDPFERRKALDEVDRQLRLAHPELFRTERDVHTVSISDVLKTLTKTEE